MFWDSAQPNKGSQSGDGCGVRKIPDNLSAQVMFNSASVYSSASESLWNKNVLCSSSVFSNGNRANLPGRPAGLRSRGIAQRHRGNGQIRSPHYHNRLSTEER